MYHSSYPRQASKRKKINKLKLIIFFLIVAGLVLTIFSLLKVLHSSKLSFGGRTTIVFATSPVFVISFEPKGDLTVLTIPDNTYTEVSRGFGAYPLSSVWQLGEMNSSTGGGGELLKETVQEFLAVPVDGWVGFKKEKFKINQEKLDKSGILELKNNLTSWRILLRPGQVVPGLKNLKTNLSLSDLLKVWWRVKNTRFDKINILQLKETNVLSPFKLADGTITLNSEPTLLDSAYQNWLKDTLIAKEHILIGVANGSKKPGLAQRVSRLIENLGGEVVSLGNDDQGKSVCQIIAENKISKSYTAKRLAAIFSCQFKNLKPENQRVDLELIIGEDYWRQLYQR